MPFLVNRKSQLFIKSFALIVFAFGACVPAFSTGCPTCQASFTTPTPVFAGQDITNVATADFNGDGHLDMAAPNHNADTIIVMAGDGAGNFSAPQSFGVGDRPTSLAVGDFNSDGKPDLAAGKEFESGVEILLNNGMGGFASATRFALPTAAASLAVADFNGDNAFDLVAIGGGFCNAQFQCTPNTITVLHNDGAGNFGSPNSFIVTRGSAIIAVADFNRDGRPDLVIGAEGFMENGTFVLLNDGTSDFAPPVQLSFSGRFTLGDFNTDGRFDLAVLSRFGPVETYLNDGAGNFGPPIITDVATGEGPAFITATDFNSDGKPDIAVTAQRTGGGIRAPLGDGEGGFEASAPVDAGLLPVSLAAADFDEDGRPDLAAVDGRTNSSETEVGITVVLNRTDCAQPLVCVSEAAVLEGNSGTTRASVLVSLGKPSGQVVTVDFNTAELVALSGVDFEPVNTTVTFNPGTTIQTVSVPIIGDTLDEFDETFKVTLSNPNNARLAAPRVPGTPTLVTIIDDDIEGPGINIDDVIVVEGDAGQTTAVFTVRITPMSQSLTLNYSVTDGTARSGSDYQSAPTGMIVFEPGATSKTIAVTVNGDLAPEQNENFFVNLTTCCLFHSRRQGMGVIIDDDTPNPNAPMLFTDKTGQAIALDSVTFVRDPFPIVNPFNLSADRRTRIMLFAHNMNLQPGQGVPDVMVRAEDSQQNIHALPVEFVGRISGVQDEIVQIVVRLTDELPQNGDLTLRLIVHDLPSNKARITLKPLPAAP